MVSGCSLVNGPRQVVSVSSMPPGATVMLDGEPVGVTPVDVSVLRHDGDPVLRIDGDGFEPIDHEIDRGLSDVFVGDLLLAAFVGHANGFGAGTQGASGHGAIGRGALGVLFVLGPVFAMGSLFDFPEEVDVRLTPSAADGPGPVAATGGPARSLVFDPESDLVDLRERLASDERGADRVRLRERLRALRVEVRKPSISGPAAAIPPSPKSRRQAIP